MSQILFDKDGNLYRAHYVESVTIEELQSEIDDVKDALSTVEDTITAAEKITGSPSDETTSETTETTETSAPVETPQPPTVEVAAVVTPTPIVDIQPAVQPVSLDQSAPLTSIPTLQ